MKQCDEIVKRLRSKANPENVAGMARFGINPTNTLGISVIELRKIARPCRLEHKLALALWQTGIHEALILAAFVDDPARVTKTQMERWARDFDSWDVCDQVCWNLFDKTPFAYEKALAWSGRRAEFVKRAGFSLMAALACHDKTAGHERFVEFLPVIARHATDDRNFVKKAVHWALRQIGKRSRRLNKQAVATARQIAKLDSRAARWIAKGALRELTSEKVKKRLAA